MSIRSARNRYIDQHQQQLARVAETGYRNMGRGAVTVFSDPGHTAPDHWSGTVYPYFMEDCLMRRLIHDIWLRNEPVKRAEVLAGFVQEVSTYDPSKGMVVVFLSVDGDVRYCQVTFEDTNDRPSTVTT